MEVITKRMNCSLPWSQFKLEGMKDCKSENDFEHYLDTIVKFQSKIKKVTKKCRYKTWTPLPYSESSINGKNMLIVIELTIIDSKVRIMTHKSIKETFFSCIVSGNHQGRRRIHVLIGLLYWYLWRIFGSFPWRKYPWHLRIL